MRNSLRALQKNDTCGWQLQSNWSPKVESQSLAKYRDLFLLFLIVVKPPQQNISWPLLVTIVWKVFQVILSFLTQSLQCWKNTFSFFFFYILKTMFDSTFCLPKLFSSPMCFSIHWGLNTPQRFWCKKPVLERWVLSKMVGREWWKIVSLTAQCFLLCDSQSPKTGPEKEDFLRRPVG